MSGSGSDVSAKVVSTSARGYAAHVAVRGHRLIVDEPPSAGGTDQGPMPTELLLAALASCYTLALRWAAQRLEVDLGEIAVTATGTYERLSFERISLVVATALPPAQADELLSAARRVCYVSNTLARDIRIDISTAQASAQDDSTEQVSAEPGAETTSTSNASWTG